MILVNVKTTSERSKRAIHAFTLMEVVVSSLIGAIMVGAIVNGYSQSARRAEWAAYSLAAQSLAMQRVEQGRAAKWDTIGHDPSPGRTNAEQFIQSNFPVTIDVLDIPISGANIVNATNFTTITTLSTVPPLKMITVQTVWQFWDRGLFTNSVVSYRAPDQ